MKYTSVLTLSSLLAVADAFVPSNANHVRMVTLLQYNADDDAVAFSLAASEGMSTEAQDLFAKKVVEMRDRAILRTKAKPADFVDENVTENKKPTIEFTKLISAQDLVPKPPTLGNKRSFAKRVKEMRRRTKKTTVESAKRVQELKRVEEQSPLYQKAPVKPSFFKGAGI